MTLAVGLNALHLVPGETGGSELYARRLIGALADADDAPRLVVLAPHEAAASLATEPWAERVEIVRVPVHARNRARRVLAEQTTLRRAVARARVRLLHNLFTTAPVLPGVPQVTTILDVIYKRFPDAHAGVLTYGMRLLVPLAARRSRRVLTLSQAAKDDIVRFLHVPSERVDVTYLGPALRTTDQLPDEELRRRLGLGKEPIVLTVSAKRPHKNLERLFEAFLGIATEGQPTLVVPGYPTFHEPALRARAEALGWWRAHPFHGLARGRPPRRALSSGDVFRLPLSRGGVRPSRPRRARPRHADCVLERLIACPRSAATLSCISTRWTSER